MVFDEQPGAGFRLPPEFGHVALIAAHPGQRLEPRPQRPPGGESSAVSPFLFHGPERHQPIEPFFAEHLAHLRDQVRGERRVAIGEVAIGQFRCAPMLSFFCEPLSHLDANANLIAVETMTLACEGWECDVSIVEPAEPSSAKPPAR